MSGEINIKHGDPDYVSMTDETVMDRCTGSFKNLERLKSLEKIAEQLIAENPHIAQNPNDYQILRVIRKIKAQLGN